MQVEMQRVAAKGLTAPNPTVLEVDTYKKKRLLDFANIGRPLVVIFGSGTWGPFGASLPDLEAAIEGLKDKADFVTVYIMEAHATDGLWAMKDVKFFVATHKTIEERNSAAKRLREFLSCPILIDDMSNEANTMYGGFPDRLTVILDGHVEYIGGKGPRGFKVDEMITAVKGLA